MNIFSHKPKGGIVNYCPNCRFPQISGYSMCQQCSLPFNSLENVTLKIPAAIKTTSLFHIILGLFTLFFALEISVAINIPFIPLLIISILVFVTGIAMYLRWQYSLLLAIIVDSVGLLFYIVLGSIILQFFIDQLILFSVGLIGVIYILRKGYMGLGVETNEDVHMYRISYCTTCSSLRDNSECPVCGNDIPTMKG